MGQWFLLSALSSCASAPPPPPTWVEVETDHVKLRVEASPEDARESASRFESMRDAIGAAGFGCTSSATSERLEVTLLTHEDFSLLGVSQAAGFYADSELTSLASKPGQIVLRRELQLQARQVFQHELTHRLVANCFPSAPIWLNEGLASFFETADVRDGRVSIGLPRYVFADDLLHVRVGMLRGSMVEFTPRELVPTPNQLRAMDRRAFDLADQNATVEVHDQRVANYAGAWALVHALKLGDAEMHRRLFDYLETLSRGELAPHDAFTQHFHDVNLDSVVLRHFRAAPSYLELEFSPSKHPIPTVRWLSEGEVSLHWAWLTSLVAPKLAPAYAERAKAHAETRGEAHLVSALTLLAARDEAAAERELRSGLQGDPSNAALLSLLLEIEVANEASRRDPELAALAARLRRVAESAEAFVALTHHDLVSGNLGAAIGDSLRAVTLRPQGSRSWAARARALGAVERWSAALEAVERAKNLLPHDASQSVQRLDELERAIREGTAREKTRASHPEID